MIMAYEFDVFLSYQHNPLVIKWLDETFLPLAENLLADVIHRKASIFRDTTAIQAGQAWEMRVKSALASSRVIIPILTPMYFQSEICVKELAVFQHRQQMLGYQTVHNPNGLIIPVGIRDGECFPQYVSQIQYLNCNDHNRVGSSFQATESYQILQNKLHPWIDQVGHVINTVPDWHNDWMNDDWLENPYVSANVVSLISYTPPTL
jgi:hypothetical protein